MDDWDAVSSPAEDAGGAATAGRASAADATGFRDAASIAQPQRPPVKRRSISGSSIAIIVLSVAVIGLSALIGLSLFHIVDFNGAASAHTQPVGVAVNSIPSGAYSGTTGCPASGGIFYIVNAKTGLVMDVSGGSKDSGGAVIQYPYGKGLNQEWQFVPVDAGGYSRYFRIVNVNSGMVLDEPGGSQASGMGIIQNPDDGGLSQRWQCISTGSNYFKIVSANSGLVLDVANTNLAQIAPLLQDSYEGGLNQQWLFVS
jgi:hypothetical protein